MDNDVTSSRRDEQSRDPAEQRAVVCLAGPTDPQDYFSAQERGLGAVTWRSPEGTDDEAWLAAARNGVVEAAGGRPVHLIATGAMVPRAILFATRHADMVKGLQLIDPVVERLHPGWMELLKAVRIPTLVIAAAPDPTTDLSVPQSIAGHVDNGVMIILDHTQPPSSTTAPGSVNEWMTTFMNITEGLFDLSNPTRNEPNHDKENEDA